MPAISHCPHCQGQISLPRGIGGESRVRCPLCQSEYLLEDAFRTAPPELVVLEVVGEAMLESADEAVGGFAGVAIDTMSRESSTEAVGAAPAPSRPIRPSGGDDLGKQMFGIVGGGALGLVVGYMLLLWIGGERSDFLDIGRKLPAFMVPREFHPLDDAYRRSYRPEQYQSWDSNYPSELGAPGASGDAFRNDRPSLGGDADAALELDAALESVLRMNQQLPVTNLQSDE